MLSISKIHLNPREIVCQDRWVHAQNENAYHWEFQIEAGKNKPLLTLQNSQKMNNPGNLAWLTAGG
jgi:hypothetical protein